eukprot:GDKH01029133.1.p1 GENE.GDKH01029133.1~~GDKH01029133.1.p1  ORF type:complete len:341 (+),score=46.62 GDKH01029133.1:81-1103(+)
MTISKIDTKGATRDVRAAIRSEEAIVRNSAFFLSKDWDNATGLAIFWGWVVAFFVVSHGWAVGAISGVTAILLNAFITSIAHEQEHDLIHDLYFKDSWFQDFAFFVIWLAKSSVSPWWRRTWHLHHHESSGQTDDVEERLLGLGLPAWSWKRVLVTLNGAFSILLVRDVKKGNPNMDIISVMNAGFLISVSNAAMALHCIANLAPAGVLAALPLFSTVWPTLEAPTTAFCFLVVYPNLLRQGALVFVSTFCHYYDIPNDVFLQVQVLNHPLFWPLQLFCWNFGSTHVIHHFVTRQPFWVRTLLGPAVVDRLVKLGIPHNDLGSWWRANRRTDLAKMAAAE